MQTRPYPNPYTRNRSTEHSRWRTSGPGASQLPNIHFQHQEAIHQLHVLEDWAHAAGADVLEVIRRERAAAGKGRHEWDHGAGEPETMNTRTEYTRE